MKRSSVLLGVFAVCLLTASSASASRQCGYTVTSSFGFPCPSNGTLSVAHHDHGRVRSTAALRQHRPLPVVQHQVDPAERAVSAMSDRQHATARHSLCSPEAPDPWAQDADRDRGAGARHADPHRDAGRYAGRHADAD